MGIPGCVIARRKRCGKARCRCARGELHGPYYYHFTRGAGGKARRRYIPKADAPRVRALCARYREQRYSRARALRDIRRFRLALRRLRRHGSDWD